MLSSAHKIELCLCIAFPKSERLKDMGNSGRRVQELGEAIVVFAHFGSWLLLPKGEQMCMNAVECTLYVLTWLANRSA